MHIMLIYQGKTYAQYEVMIASPWGSSARGEEAEIMVHGSVLVFWLLQSYLLTFNASLRWNYVGYVPFSSGTSGAGIKAVPSRLSAVIAQN